MELKQCQRAGDVWRNQLLIAPLWNWNSKRDRRSRTGVRPFNRTFMELKPTPLRRNFSRKGPFNRTFMELKLDKITRMDNLTRLLIAPLWNWNYLSSAFSQKSSMTFNRTFMELKHLILSVARRKAKHLLIAPLWNWNAMNRSGLHRLWATFNRTFMELKQQT